ncbi:sensor histidine kinase [Streptomyces sp. NPDC050504]|uniref:sensor histidine kinase n=1 Tax=Streptomyces sp. NPDC050504 TaxID=3365618 RepID=UPI00379791FB
MQGSRREPSRVERGNARESADAERVGVRGPSGADGMSVREVDGVGVREAAGVDGVGVREAAGVDGVGVREAAGVEPDGVRGPAGAGRQRLVHVADVAFVVVIGVLTAAAGLASGEPDGLGAAGAAVDLALIAVGSLVLVAHRSAPVPVLALTTAAMLGYVFHGDGGSWAALPVVAAVHAVSRSGNRGVGAAAGGVFLAGYVTAHAGADGVAERTVLLAGWFLCAVVTGIADKNWQAYLRQTEQRAADAERTREEVALRRAGEERLRIARELHDSLTHSISIVKLQAGVAVHLANKRGDEAPPALLAIQEASGEAMRELRATLEVLRTDVAPDGAGGLARVDELAERARSAGVPVTVTVEGAVRSLPPDVDRAAFRIVQEALTNVARHADRAEAKVRITYGRGELLVRVEDEGPLAPGDPVVPGTGLTGMRERTAALGGTLSAAARESGGFAVRARLPLEAR